MEVLETPEYKEMLWQTGDELYYPKGVTDPDYCVLRFTAVSGRRYGNFQSDDFDIFRIHLLAPFKREEEAPMKNHVKVDGKLLQTNKKWSHLKSSQKTWIFEITKEEHAAYIKTYGKLPMKQSKQIVVDKVYDRIKEREIWIPYGETVRRLATSENSLTARTGKARFSIRQKKLRIPAPDTLTSFAFLCVISMLHCSLFLQISLDLLRQRLGDIRHCSVS